MTTPAKPAEPRHIGIDVCSGPSLPRAVRLAQAAARFAAPADPAPAAPEAVAEAPTPRAVAAE